MEVYTVGVAGQTVNLLSSDSSGATPLTSTLPLFNGMNIYTKIY